MTIFKSVTLIIGLHDSRDQIKDLTDGITAADATALAISTLQPQAATGATVTSGTHTGARKRLKKNLFCTTELGSWALCMFKSTWKNKVEKL